MILFSLHFRPIVLLALIIHWAFGIIKKHKLEFGCNSINYAEMCSPEVKCWGQHIFILNCKNVSFALTGSQPKRNCFLGFSFFFFSRSELSIKCSQPAPSLLLLKEKPNCVGWTHYITLCEAQPKLLLVSIPSCQLYLSQQKLIQFP